MGGGGGVAGMNNNYSSNIDMQQGQTTYNMRNGMNGNSSSSSSSSTNYAFGTYQAPQPYQDGNALSLNSFMPFDGVIEPL